MKVLKNNWVKICAYFYIALLAFIVVATFSTAYLEHRFLYIILTIFTSLIVVILFILLRKHIKKIVYNKAFFYIVIFLGIMLHCLLLSLHHTDFTSDYGTLYRGAKSFAENTFVNNDYVALFPHLWGYMSFLGSIFKIFGSSYAVVTITNIILNLISVFLIYKILARLWNKDVGCIGALIWIYNPVTLFWCIYPFAGTAFYTFFFASILITILLLEKNKKYWYAMLLGVFLFFTNQFRPIMSIYFIALFLYFIFKTVIQKELSIKKYFLLFALTFFTYFTLSKCSIMYLEHVNQLKASSNPVGFSFLVGSNLERDGQWNEDDSAILGMINKKEKNATKVQNMMMEKGINRYQEQGLKIIPLYMHKFRILTGKTAEDSWNAMFSVIINNTLFRYKQIIFMITNLYYFILLVLNFTFAYYILKNEKEKNSQFCSMLMLFVLGFSVASLLFEVSARYYLPAVSIIVLGAGIGLYSILENKILYKNEEKEYLV